MADRRSLQRESREGAQQVGYGIDLPYLPSRSYFRWKGLLDRAVAAALLVPGLPIIAILVVVIRLASKGPGIYSQARVGSNGRIYTMYKLRSMRCDAEASTGPVWSVGGSDPRVTRLGYWLRKLHLDELPQLFNVIKGEMSLIGPRPERPEFVKLLSKNIPNYTERLQVVPGVTGLAQINLPPDTDLDSVRRKLVLDIEYIESANLLLDLRIFISTLCRIVGVRGDLAMRFMRLARVVKLDEAEFLPNLAENIPRNSSTLSAAEVEDQPAVVRISPTNARQAARNSAAVVGATVQG